MKVIGENFSADLRDAGLAGLAFAWTADGVITFDKSVTPQQIAAIEAVKAAHKPKEIESPEPAISLTLEELARAIVDPAKKTALAAKLSAIDTKTP